jgi:hypothetical protein
MTAAKDFDLTAIRRRFTDLFSPLGAAAKAAGRQPAVSYGYMSAAASTPCPFIIRPSSRQRVVIEAHRSDWL